MGKVVNQLLILNKLVVSLQVTNSMEQSVWERVPNPFKKVSDFYFISRFIISCQDFPGRHTKLGK
jgi:hypothetical protein